MDKFLYTTNGYEEVKKWLQEINEWDRVSNHGFSTDGWSIIQSANFLYNKINGN